MWAMLVLSMGYCASVRLYDLNRVDDVNKLIYSLINLYNHAFIHVINSIYFMR